jgi:hypothetical protein
VKITLPWWAYVVAGLLVVSGGALALRDHDAHVRLEVLYQQTLDSLGRKDTALRDSLKTNAIVLHTDTIVLTRWETKYATLHDTVLRDVHDTVAVVQFVHTADSTIAACSVLVTDCQARTRILTEQVAAAEAERDLYRKEAPGFLQRHEVGVCSATGVVGFVVGVIAGHRL